MTSKFYKRFQIYFFILFIPVILINQIGDKIPWLINHYALATFIFYANPVLSLFLLYFGIYAHKCKVRNVPKMDGPISIIIIGGLFTLLAIGRPIIGFMLIKDSQIKPLGISKLESIRETALDLNKDVKDRLIAAQYYYVNTGIFIEYIDVSKERVSYNPTKKDKIKREQHIKLIKEIESEIVQSKNVVVNLMALASVSCFGLFIFLFLQSRRHETGPNRGRKA